MFISCVVYIMNNIIFLKDDKGEKQALNFINDLYDKAEQGDVDVTFVTLLQVALEHIEDAETFPLGKDEIYRTTLTLEEDGISKEIDLIKPLHASPVCELRMDWYPDYCFRAIFFPYKYEGENYYCFTKAFFKKGKSDPTNLYRDQARRLYDNLKMKRLKFPSE